MNKFRKSERLSGKAVFSRLAASKQFVFSFPCRVLYEVVPVTDIHAAQVAFVVPKRLFKKSSQRNRIKRLLREAYRLNKQPLIDYLEQRQQAAHIIFIYTHKEELTQQETSAKIVLTLQKLINQFSGVERTNSKT